MANIQSDIFENQESAALRNAYDVTTDGEISCTKLTINGQEVTPGGGGISEITVSTTVSGPQIADITVDGVSNPIYGSTVSLKYESQLGIPNVEIQANSFMSCGLPTNVTIDNTDEIADYVNEWAGIINNNNSTDASVIFSVSNGLAIRWVVDVNVDESDNLVVEKESTITFSIIGNSVMGYIGTAKRIF